MPKNLPLINTPTTPTSLFEDRLRPVDFPREGIEWSKEVPVSVNDTYGDPFIIEQVHNTVAKLNLLGDQRHPIAIFTKAGPDDRVLDQLRTVSNADKVIVFYSLTGLDEADISFTERRRMIVSLTSIFPHVVVFARPIIEGRNDSAEMLSSIVDVAKELKLPFVLGGLHDRHKQKRLDSGVKEHLLDMCDDRGIPAFYKTSCAAAWAYGLDCWVHDIGEPRRVDVALELGYQLEVGEREIVLPAGTTGDINFLRMLCRTEVFVSEITSNYNVLTVPLREGLLLEATSSWFAWSENIETCLDCDYCIIKQIEYLRRKRVSVGVHPSRLTEVVDHDRGHQVLSTLRGTKLDRKRDVSTMHRYADLRVTSPCHTRRYPAGATSC
jgi:hypothetical protein